MIASPQARLAAVASLALSLGVLTGLGFQPVGWWWGTILGFGGLTLLIRQVGARRAFGLGYVFGLGYFGISEWWLVNFGWFAPVALVAFLSIWAGLAAWATTWIVGNVPRLLPAWPVVAAATWTATEWLAQRFPFGGYGWSRFVYTVTDQPLGGWLPVIGAGGVSFLVALAGALLAWVVAGSTRRRRFGAAMAAVALLAAGAALTALPEPAPAGSLRVGVVQGNTDVSAGTLSIGSPGSITAMHLGETITALANWRATGAQPPDFLLLPENSADSDPTKDALTDKMITQASNLAGLPMLVGVISLGPGADERQTSALWWVPGDGPEARLDKVNLAPFGEFVPLSSLLRRLVPMTRLVGPQSVPGTGPRVMHVTLGDGSPVSIGNIICYELAYDSTVYSTVRNDAQIITVQSSNESMSGTWQPAQQFAITRVRAMELRRQIVVATTQSLSGLIDAKGRVLDVTREGEPAFRLYVVATGTGVTPGVLIGPWLEGGVAALAGAGVLLGIIGRLRSTRVVANHAGGQP